MSKKYTTLRIEIDNAQKSILEEILPEGSKLFMNSDNHPRVFRYTLGRELTELQTKKLTEQLLEPLNINKEDIAFFKC